MTKLYELFQSDNILLGVVATSKKRIFEQASQTFALLYGLDQKTVFNTLIDREKLGSTYLGHNTCIPHGRLSNINTPKALFVRLQDEIKAGGDSERVNKLFFLLAPEESASDHLQILAQFSHLISDPVIEKKLNEVTTAEELSLVIRQWCSLEYPEEK